MAKIEITETELRGLIFWATNGIEKSHGGSYASTLEFIRNKVDLMHNNKARYRNIYFGKRLK